MYLQVEWHSPDYPTHTMYECVKYTVHHKSLSIVEIALSLPNGQDADLILGENCVAWVMNHVGKTIAVIRPRIVDQQPPVEPTSGEANMKS